MSLVTGLCGRESKSGAPAVESSKEGILNNRVLCCKAWLLRGTTDPLRPLRGTLDLWLLLHTHRTAMWIALLEAACFRGTCRHGEVDKPVCRVILVHCDSFRIRVSTLCTSEFSITADCTGKNKFDFCATANAASSPTPTLHGPDTICRGKCCLDASVLTGYSTNGLLSDMLSIVRSLCCASIVS